MMTIKQNSKTQLIPKVDMRVYHSVTVPRI